MFPNTDAPHIIFDEARQQAVKAYRIEVDRSAARDARHLRLNCSRALRCRSIPQRAGGRGVVTYSCGGVHQLTAVQPRA